MKNKRMQKMKIKRMQEIKNKRKQKGCTVILGGGKNFHFAEKICQLPSACLSFPNCYVGLPAQTYFAKVLSGLICEPLKSSAESWR